MELQDRNNKGLRGDAGVVEGSGAEAGSSPLSTRFDSGVRGQDWHRPSSRRKNVAPCSGLNQITPVDL